MTIKWPMAGQIALKSYSGRATVRQKADCSLPVPELLTLPGHTSWSTSINKQSVVLHQISWKHLYTRKRRIFLIRKIKVFCSYDNEEDLFGESTIPGKLPSFFLPTLFS